MNPNEFNNMNNGQMPMGNGQVPMGNGPQPNPNPGLGVFANELDPSSNRLNSQAQGGSWATPQQTMQQPMMNQQPMMQNQMYGNFGQPPIQNNVVKPKSKLPGFIVLIIVLAILGFGGFKVYNSFINKNSSNDSKKDSVVSESKSERILDCSMEYKDGKAMYNESYKATFNGDKIVYVEKIAQKNGSYEDFYRLYKIKYENQIISSYYSDDTTKYSSEEEANEKYEKENKYDRSGECKDYKLSRNGNSVRIICDMNDSYIKHNLDDKEERSSYDKLKARLTKERGFTCK